MENRRPKDMPGNENPGKRVHKGSVSRRTVLRGVGLVVGSRWVGPVPAPAGEAAPAQTPDGPAVLSTAEYRTLEAFANRLIPSDANGPGAREAMAARFIDRALLGALADARPAYAEGLAGLDRYARSSGGAGFADLSEADQDALLAAIQNGESPDVGPGFFNTVRSHTIQGTFSDPFYGGNANFVGWDMIGYPGVRTAVPAEYQQTGVEHPPNHLSVYESPMFEPGED